MSHKLNLVAIHDGCACIAATGDITAGDLRANEKNLFESALGAKWAEGKVILDMGKVRFIDSAAIGWLITSQREFKKHGGSLAVYSLDARVRRMLDILKVGQIVALASDEASARKLALTPTPIAA